MGDVQNFGGRLVVLFDGRCGLCNRSVRWLLRRDRGDRLRFVASESAKGAELVARLGFAEAGPDELGPKLSRGNLPGTVPDTILVVRDLGGPAERILGRSDAVVALLAELPGPWPAVAAALGWIPRPLRDLGYRLVARCRYRIWGRLEKCPVPTSEERKRFL
ncbi:MAG: DCC1-like thiol-disulfide oxidoreductase family protein [Terracidiphilus sp.]